ncbi:hypothetical protein BD289DRAFT_479803 [Coniella lustricola]|uniref:Uncharacterized protein n=1 Tax=Coniella lustricola TaxID=2025994 RepID=A0A2T3AI59_9PEZI|nr:hypothetical protein BD289DRAFT_479803 [Coniella lustricola]
MNNASTCDDVGRMAVAIEDSGGANNGVDDRKQFGTNFRVDCGTTHRKKSHKYFGDLWATSSIYSPRCEYGTGSVDQNNLSDASLWHEPQQDS